MGPTPIRPETVAALPARPLRDRFHRAGPRHLREQILNTEGSRLYGGRYNAKGSFGALYCGESAAVCAAEVGKATGGRILGPFVLATIDVDLQRVVDLTDGAVLSRLGLQPEDLVAPEWAVTQEIGRLAREAGFEGLVVPAAAAPGANLVLFPDQLDPASSVNLLAVEPVAI